MGYGPPERLEDRTRPFSVDYHFGFSKEKAMLTKAERKAIIAVARAKAHGWVVHNINKRGTMMNLHGNHIIFIDNTGYVQYRGSRRSVGMAPISQ